MSPIIQWLLAKSQMQKTSWSPPGSVPAVSYNSGIGSAPQPVAAKPPMATSSVQPQTSGSMAKDTLQSAGRAAKSTLDSVLARGGGGGWKPPSGVPAVSYNTGFGAAAEPVAARPPVATQSGPKPSFMDINLGPSAAKKPVAQTRPAKPVNATPAAMQSAPEQEMHPSDRAKAIFAQVNQRRRDAAFGRGAFSAAEEKALMEQGNSFLNQSNTTRNAPGYKPDAKSMHPRDQADRLRIQLNQQRSAAGGEVAQAPQVMRQLNQFGAAADAMPAPKMPGNMVIPGKPRPMPAGPTPAPMPRRSIPEPMIAKTSSASMPFRFGAYIGSATQIKKAEGYANQVMNNLTGANVQLPPQQKTMAGRLTDPNYSVLAAGGQHIAKQMQSPFKPVGGALGGLPAMANALNNSRIGLGRQIGESAYNAGKAVYDAPSNALTGVRPNMATAHMRGTK